MNTDSTAREATIAVATAAEAEAKADAAAATRPGDRVDRHERFIPVTRYDLQACLARARGWQGAQAKLWQRALHCLAAWRHQHYRERLQTLLECYLPFSPDTDTAALRSLAPEERERCRRQLVAGIEGLLERANYTRMSEDDLQRLLRERSPYGLYLDVDLSEYEEVLLYYRGSDVETREERAPWWLYLRKERFEVPIFKRLFLLVKLKTEETRLVEIMAAEGVERARAKRILRQRRAHLPPQISCDHIYLKIFKRIPQIDLEMLFPNTKIGFRPLDKLKLGVTAGGGTVAGVVGSATKLMAATNPFALAGALAALAAVLFRQVTKFFHTRNRYMMELAQNLYFHNLANNRGALTLLADRAEEEDVKEDLLLYTFLCEQPVSEGELAVLDRRIEDFLREECGVAVNFDAEDALQRLMEYGVVELTAERTLHALPPAEACRHLDRLWDRLLDAETFDAAEAAATG